MYKIDDISFQLGMICSFCEMVHQGVKRLALSPPVEQENIETVFAEAQGIAESFGVICYRDDDFIATDLAPRNALVGKTVILFYKDESVLQEYLALKSQNPAQTEATQKLCELLSYPRA